MSLPDYKALKKLADTCRKVGIKSFKNADLEFTLSDDFVAKQATKRSRNAGKENTSSIAHDIIQSDTLTEDQLLFYSTVDPSQETKQ